MGLWQMDNKIEVKTSARPDVSPSAASPAGGRRRRPLWLAGIAVAVALAGAVGAWWRFSAPVPVHYVTAPAARGAITQSVTATGTVNPELTIIVGSYVSGVIQQLFCDYNTEVKAGQVCAKIDPRPYQATLAQYSAQLLRDQAVLAKDRFNLARYQKLAAQNAIARQQAEDQAFIVQQDEATVKLDEALVEGANFNLGYTNIISPVDGTVVSRNVTQGQTVASSFQTPTLFLIASDLKKMEVDTNVSESDIGGVKNGDKAMFTVDAYPNRVFQGAVSQVRQSPQTVQNVVTYDVVVSVDNSDLALMPGMTASTQIVVAQRNDVLRVPDQALRYAPGGLAGAGPGMPASEEGRVWVLRDGAPVAVPVVLGLDDGNFTEIVKGDLRPGDAVITAENRDQANGRPGLPLPRL
ncbi:MAG TPA: efflux RND transporter periplasmic adaptor subunit [Stellaceae bacterium]|nr:efflux RND transporter periplasmic adaptor subunit [Stellaceae bacterium]